MFDACRKSAVGAEVLLQKSRYRRGCAVDPQAMAPHWQVGTLGVDSFDVNVYIQAGAAASAADRGGHGRTIRSHGSKVVATCA
jgi:hypothetical protein